MEPEYSVKQKPIRVVISKVLFFATAGIIFYLALLLNFKLLELKVSNWIHILIASILAILLIVEGLLIFYNSKKQVYNFFIDRATHKEEVIHYNIVSSIKVEENLFDHLFKTGTVVLEPGFEVKHVENPHHLFIYLEDSIRNNKFKYSQS